MANWNHLHKLTEEAAQHSGHWPPLFGGTGSNCHVEESPLGLAKLYHRACVAIETAWGDLHKGGKTAPEDSLRRMVAYALAAGRLHEAVVAELGGERQPMTLCYVSDHGRGPVPQLHVQGLRWRWSSTDLGFVPAPAAEAFAAGGSLDAFKAALDETAHITDGYENMM
jgi:hypothetical protein